MHSCVSVPQTELGRLATAIIRGQQRLERARETLFDAHRRQLARLCELKKQLEASQRRAPE
jgi:hypothetical protein